MRYQRNLYTAKKYI